MTFEILTIIVLFNAAVTIGLWREAARRPKKLKKKFLNRLWYGKRITPEHEPPPLTPIENWEQFSSDFKDFANVINWHLVDYVVKGHLVDFTPWCVQELPTFKLSKLGAPDYGRRYAVFYNQVRLGEIELQPDFRYSTETPDVTIHIELNWVRLLPFETIRDFLRHMAVSIFEYQLDTLEYFEMNQKIDRALMSVLWKTQQISEFEYELDHGQITVDLTGAAGGYLEDRRRWQRNLRAADHQSATTQ